jgi:S-adenosylmethionine:tRNA ribosyltransferase-isomerase
MRSQFSFTLPPALEAAEPPEARGLRRDQVRLLLIPRDGGPVAHHRFNELPWLLDPGDLVVVNTSRTLPASLLGHTVDGVPVEIRLVTYDQGEGGEDGGPGGGRRWAALPLGVPADGSDPALVPTDARPPAPELQPGDRITFAGSAGLPPTASPRSSARSAGVLTATVLGRHAEAPPLVWLAFDRDGPRLLEALHRAGRPVRYAYVPRPWALHHYQTLFAATPGSVEMASAGRPFTVQTLRALHRRGIGLATISLHAGLSTYGDREVDATFVPAERYQVPVATAAAIGRAHTAGGRVIAVGTTVVRALETTGGQAGVGVTRLRITPTHRLQVVDGLLTGLHEPEASHLDLVSAFISPKLVRRAYDQALAAGYLWHEFGDVCLIV